jgi:hypothetical protein
VVRCYAPSPMTRGKEMFRIAIVTPKIPQDPSRNCLSSGRDVGDQQGHARSQSRHAFMGTLSILELRILKDCRPPFWLDCGSGGTPRSKRNCAIGCKSSGAAQSSKSLMPDWRTAILRRTLPRNEASGRSTRLADPYLLGASQRTIPSARGAERNLWNLSPHGDLVAP